MDSGAVRVEGGESMSVREQYEQKAEAMAQPIIDQFGFELVDVEYVKEGGTWYLRAYIDKPGGITIDDCELVSRAFSDVIDQNDFIEDSYIMEVSSPGLLRPLKKDKDFNRYLEKPIEMRTYKMIDKKKEFMGVLKDYNKEQITIEEPDGELRVLQRNELALVRPYVEF